MKKYLRALLMSFSMYTAIPMPFCRWDEEARPLINIFLPAVGAVIGLLWTLAAWFIGWANLPPLAGGIVLCAFPFLITGGIHFDGYLDVTDAVRSYRDQDERRKIMKDPHVGSFAVLAGVLLILAQFSLLSSAGDGAEIFSLTFIPIVSRSMSGLCVSALPPLSSSEYANTDRIGAKGPASAYFAAVLILVSAGGFLALGKYGLVSAAVILGYSFALWRAVRSLGGISGDIAGYALTFGELCGTAVFALI